MADETVFYDVVDRINALALDDGDWPETLTLIADLFGAVGGSFELLETKTKQPVFFQYGSELGDAPTQSYLAYYGNISPRVKFGITQPTGAISYDHMILSESEIDRDEFYMDCIAPHQGLRYFVRAKLICSPSHDAVFAIQRSPEQGHVGRAEIATMERLLPYLQNAMDLKFRIAEAQTKAAVGIDGLEQLQEACLILSATGAVLHANAEADALLSAQDGVDVINGRLTFADKAAARWYETALGRSLPPDDEPTPDFPAQRRSGRRPYIVSLRRVPAQNAFSRAAWPAASLLLSGIPIGSRG